MITLPTRHKKTDFATHEEYETEVAKEVMVALYCMDLLVMDGSLSGVVMLNERGRVQAEQLLETTHQYVGTNFRRWFAYLMQPEVQEEIIDFLAFDPERN